LVQREAWPLSEIKNRQRRHLRQSIKDFLGKGYKLACPLPHAPADGAQGPHRRDRPGGYGLDFFETVFEVVDYDDDERWSPPTAAFPPATRTGVGAWSTNSSRARAEYGLSKIYELVINNDPCFAYLLEATPMVDQKLVMAHVYGHVDFFKNNFTFSVTNRKMVDEMANHGTRVRRMDRQDRRREG
jgi:hypothetical protein